MRHTRKWKRATNLTLATSSMPVYTTRSIIAVGQPQAGQTQTMERSRSLERGGLLDRSVHIRGRTNRRLLNFLGAGHSPENIHALRRIDNDELWWRGSAGHDWRVLLINASRSRVFSIDRYISTWQVWNRWRLYFSLWQNFLWNSLKMLDKSSKPRRSTTIIFTRISFSSRIIRQKTHPPIKKQVHSCVPGAEKK